MAKTEPLGAKLLPWSITRLKDFERCPRVAYESHVLKNRKPQGPAAARGEAIHKLAEAYVLAKAARPRMPAELAKHGPMFRALRKERLVETERRFGVTDAWAATDFFASDVWGRGVYDVVALRTAGVRVIDHKTGKRYPDHVDQLHFYAAAALAAQPLAPGAVAEAWYLDLGPQETLRVELTRDDAARVRAGFDERVAQMTTTRVMEERPNAFCRWCHLHRANGGDCKAGG